MKIESRDLKIDELLSGNYLFVPRFQRPYSWEEENIFEFWNDISSVLGDTYFIGSMVVYQRRSNELGLVDGQQRITTITILLCVIRDIFEELGEQDKALGLHQYIERRNRENKNKYVLETETSFPFLQEMILSMEEPEIEVLPGEEEVAIDLAKVIFTKNINEQLESCLLPDATDLENVERKVDWLVKLRDTVLDLSVILISLDNEDDAYLIFETLNTRGKDLSLSDLMKNHFAKNIKAKGDVDHANIKWKSVLEILNESDTPILADTFIAHSWASRFEAIPVKKAFPKLKSEINSQTARNHLNGFLKDAEYYRSVFEPSYGWTTNERRAKASLAAFRLFKIAQPAPALLSLVRAYKDGKIKFSKLCLAFRAIENFHFAFTAVTSSRSSGGISGMYSSFGRRLYEAEDSNRAAIEIAELMQKLRDRRPSPTEFSANFENILYTNALSKQRSLVRYTLLKLQRVEHIPHLGRDDDLTIEHLYPQSRKNNEFPEEIIGQIGNLLLVDEETNGDLKEKSFKEKKEILYKKGYRLPQILAEVDDLTPDLIIQNTLARAQLANTKAWGQP
ncbi:DUF262 domain-containing protein [Brucella anthropi]|uniref:DUF262 domain-containing protein n=1 Tax=Brucella anthropi TaxID=529 RepID=UPI00124E3BB2|nr:DUF262 domain-containing protein [Brucella anthropi]KAB2759923.1 DUF262 domain-containing protein [Brucella anthropi]